ncbi:HD domain-containing protein [Candidatus Uhrbacteria bacterium]|nr:HD domain-containing protein [Candidatus Uhrbacteria bacterium]
MDFAAKKSSMLELVQKHHAGQFRVGEVPVWHHLARVSGLLETVLGETREGAAGEREDIIVAALAHDSMEDTAVTPDELKAILGEHGLALVEGMTNRFGDDHPEPYVHQVIESEEGVRLIKLSDLFDNCTSVTYNLFGLGTKWNDEYFLPIVRPMIAAIIPTPFHAFSRTGELLKAMVRASYANLLEEHRRYKEAGRNGVATITRESK